MPPTLLCELRPEEEHLCDMCTRRTRDGASHLGYGFRVYGFRVYLGEDSVGGGDGLRAVCEGRDDVEECADVGVEGDEGQGAQGLEVAAGE